MSILHFEYSDPQLRDWHPIEIGSEVRKRGWLADQAVIPPMAPSAETRHPTPVQDPLAEMILAGSVKDGEKVTVSAGKQGLTFNGKLAQAAYSILSSPGRRVAPCPGDPA